MFPCATELDAAGLREVGDEAIWTLSSGRNSNGVPSIRDNNLETFWQSDSVQPHSIKLEFAKPTNIVDVSIFTDYSLDESYTPKCVVIRGCNNTFSSDSLDLRDLCQVVELDQPTGWVKFKLGGGLSDSNHDTLGVRVTILQIVFLNSHDGGRDTHIRQVKVFAPDSPSTSEYMSSLSDGNIHHWTTAAFGQFAAIR